LSAGAPAEDAGRRLSWFREEERPLRGRKPPTGIAAEAFEAKPVLGQIQPIDGPAWSASNRKVRRTKARSGGAFNSADGEGEV
jgi:hypothetical protein